MALNIPQQDQITKVMQKQCFYTEQMLIVLNAAEREGRKLSEKEIAYLKMLERLYAAQNNKIEDHETPLAVEL